MACGFKQSRGLLYRLLIYAPSLFSHVMKEAFNWDTYAYVSFSLFLAFLLLACCVLLACYIQRLQGWICILLTAVTSS